MSFKLILKDSRLFDKPTGLARLVIHRSSPAVSSNPCKVTIRATRIVQTASREVHRNGAKSPPPGER